MKTKIKKAEKIPINEPIARVLFECIKKLGDIFKKEVILSNHNGLIKQKKELLSSDMIIISLPFDIEKDDYEKLKELNDGETLFNEEELKTDGTK